MSYVIVYKKKVYSLYVIYFAPLTMIITQDIFKR